MDINTNAAPPEYTTPPAYAITPKEQVKKCYNRACMAMLFQFLIANAVAIIASIVYSSILTAQAMAEGLSDYTALTNRVTELMNPAVTIALNAIAFLIANPLAYFIGNVMTKKYYRAKPFGGIKLPAADCVLAVLAVIGLQGFSLLVQYGLVAITGISAIDEATAQMMSFSDDIVKNVILVIYTVIIAAATEELLCRGLVLKLFSPVSKKFAVIASAVLFGVMHGNFGQMFNGFLLGLVMGYVAVKSKSLWLPIICHMAANTNAMVLGYFEYKNGEDFITTELIYSAVLVVVAIISIALLIKRNGKIDEENDGYPVEQALEVPEEEKPDSKGTLLVKTPCFWIFIVIYLISSLVAILPQILAKISV
ncbi:MAG: CPBP family intramembrane metalloprotease [Oscillospiraceae bacterium]|nr:CPBP family intramembrane metalloprotease [Oscillospiraceae bacterium]